jgi:PKD repeat protein
VPSASTKYHATTINASVANADTWWVTLGNSLMAGLGSLGSWFSTQLNNALSWAGNLNPIQPASAAPITPIAAPTGTSYPTPTIQYQNPIGPTQQTPTAGSTTPTGSASFQPGNNYTPAPTPTGPKDPNAGAKPGDPSVSYGGTVPQDTTPAPTVAIVLSVTSGKAPLGVTLYVRATGAANVTVYWGDGATSAGLSPQFSHTYTGAGTRRVVVQAVGATGKTATAIASVSVLPSVSGAPGGKTVPAFHDGGVFQAPPGETEGIAKLQAGEKVSTPAQVAASDRLLVEILDTLKDIRARLAQGMPLDVEIKSDWPAIEKRIARAGMAANFATGIRRSG